MSKVWATPYYSLQNKEDKEIDFDVTSSMMPGLSPNKTVFSLIKYFKDNHIEKIVDFGAGELRHCFPFLKAGFQVCAVEFEEQFVNENCRLALKKARRNPNFSTLIWPKDFKKDKRIFDAALLCFVIQTMPIEKERNMVLKLLYRKMATTSYLLYMSRFNRVKSYKETQRIGDGYYTWNKRKYHSFYTEFTTETTHKMIESYKFKRIKSLGEGGKDQIFLYRKGEIIFV
jgi:hypothetical protein